MKSSQIWSIAGITTVTAVVGYAIYFDHRRRNDPQFRKELNKDKKRNAKAAKRDAKASQAAGEARLQDALNQVKDENYPVGVEEKEKFFLTQITLGETLAAQGPTQLSSAAAAFFRALKVYPQPTELIGIYQKAVPADVLDMVMRMIAKDVASSSSDVNEIDDDEPQSSSNSSNPTTSSTSTAAQSGFGSASGGGGAPAPSTTSQSSSTTTPETDFPSQENGAGISSSNPSLQDWDTLSATSLGPNQTSTTTTTTTSNSEKKEEIKSSSSNDQSGDEKQNLNFGSAPGSHTHVGSEGVSFGFGGSQNQ